MFFKRFISILVLFSSLCYTFHLTLKCHFGHSKSSTSNFVDKPYEPNLNETTGVGFDLTLSYGTAAISFANGTTIKIAKVEADEAYREAIYRLSLASSQHVHPPYDNMEEWIHDQPRQKLRRWRKSVGLPASHDVGAIANLLRALRERTEEYLGHTVPSALLTVPHLFALYDEDVRDAFEWIGLRYIAAPYVFDLFRETAATYAGDGLGLCKDPSDYQSCREEERLMPGEGVLSVSYSRTALFVGLSYLASAKFLWEPQYQIVLNYSLGYDNLSTWTSDNGLNYWEAVAEALRRIIVQHPLTERPEKILLQGECVGRKDFLETLEHALADLVDDVPEKIVHHDNVFVAALGAAEFAKRALLDEKNTNRTWSALRAGRKIGTTHKLDL